MRTPSIFDTTLTVNNADKRGYTYVGDVRYYVFIHNEQTKVIKRLCREDGFRLGNPDVDDSSGFCYGLYAPAQKRKRRS